MPTNTKDEYQIINDFIHFGYDCLTDDFSHFDDGD